MSLFHGAGAVAVLTVPAVLSAAACATPETRAQTPAPDGTVLNCLAHPHIRPETLPITCADLNHFISGITWHSWDDTSAHGQGIDDRNLCVPVCAGGQRQTVPVSFELSKPVNGVFTLVTITGADGKRGTYALPG